MASGHLIADSQLALRSDKNLDDFVHAGIKIVAFGSLQALYVDYRSFDPVRNTERRIADFLRFFAEDRVQKLEFGSRFSFALGSNLSDKDVSGPDFRTDADDSFRVEVVEALFAGIRDVPGQLFGSELRLADFGYEFLDMYRGEHVLFNDSLRNKDGVFVVVSVPGHESDQDVSSECEFAVIRRRAVRERSPLLHLLSGENDGTLVITGVLVGSLVLEKGIFVANRSVLEAFRLNQYLVRGDELDDAGALGLDQYS